MAFWACNLGKLFSLGTRRTRDETLAAVTGLYVLASALCRMENVAAAGSITAVDLAAKSAAVAVKPSWHMRALRKHSMLSVRLKPGLCYAGGDQGGQVRNRSVNLVESLHN